MHDERRLAQIDAPHYCAGMIIVHNVVVDAAPIIRWTIGRFYQEAFDYFRKKKYGINLYSSENGWVLVRPREC